MTEHTARASTVSDAVASRYSVRQFLADKPVPRAVVEDLLRAAARAPSGGNLQPWRCYVVAGAARQRLVDAVLEQVDEGVLSEGVAEHGATGPYHVYPARIFLHTRAHHPHNRLALPYLSRCFA